MNECFFSMTNLIDIVRVLITYSNIEKISNADEREKFYKILGQSGIKIERK